MKCSFLVFLLLLVHTSWGQEGWRSVYQQAQQQYQQGNLRESYQLAKQALVRIRLEHNDNLPAHADNLRLLSLICYSSAQMHEGIQHAHHELKLRRQIDEAAPAMLAETLHNLAMLQVGIQQYDSAIFYLQKALATVPDHEVDKQLEILYQTGRAYQALGQVEQAHAHYQKIIQHCGSGAQHRDMLFQTMYQQAMLALPEDTRQAFAVLDTLRQAMKMAGDTLSKVYIHTVCQLAEQEKQFAHPQAAVDLYEQAKQLLALVRPVDSLQYAHVLDQLGMLRLSQGNHQQAAYLISRSHLIRSQYQDSRPDLYWVSVDHMAQVLLEEQQPEEAQRFYEEAAQQADTTGLMPLPYAVVLNNLAQLYAQQENYPEANTYYRRALCALQKIAPGNSKEVEPQTITIYYNIARNFQQRGQFDSAIYFYQQAIARSKEHAGRTSPEYRSGINSMAGLYQDIGRFTEADIFYQEALQLEQAVSGVESNAYANLLNNYALLLQAKGDYLQAEAVLHEAIAIKKKQSEIPEAAKLPALSNLGLLYLNTANYAKAREALQEALMGYQRLLPDTDPALIAHLVNMARLEVAEANYTRAEPLLKKARTIAEASYGSKHPAFASIQLEMANLYMNLGNYAAVEALLQQSRQIFQRKYGKYHPDYAAATQNLAALHEAIGNDSLAEVYFQEALQIDAVVSGRHHPDYAVALNNLASFYQNTGRHEQALPLLEDALAISRSIYGKEHPSYIATLLNLGILYQENEQYGQAEPMIEEALALRKKVLGELHPDYAYALYSKAVLYHHMQRYQEAMPIFQKVVESYLRQIKAYFPALSEKEKSAFYNRIEPVLHAYRNFVVDVFVHAKYQDKNKGYDMLGELYNVQLATKAMLLNTSGKIRRNILQSGNQDLIQVYDAWIKQKEMLAQAYTLSRQSRQEKQLDVEAAERKANDLEKQLSAGSALFAQDMGFSNVTWQDIQRRLGPDEAALEIVRGQRAQHGEVFYIALLVLPFQPHPSLVVLPQGNEMEGKNYAYYKNAVAFRVKDTLSYELYWRNIQRALPRQVQTVYVAPDGIYNKVSLNSLYDRKSRAYLLETLNIEMLSSTRDVPQTDQAAPLSGRNRQAYLFGYPNYQLEISTQADKPAPSRQSSSEMLADAAAPYPFRVGVARLPGTRREVRNVEERLQQFGWDTHLFTENVALEENVKQIKQPDLLHLATHGYFMSDLPVGEQERLYGIHLKSLTANPLLRSGLLLAGSEQTIAASGTDKDMVLDREAEDGILTAYEAVNLDLRGTALVVLSACETGLGDIRNGEGVYGLQRAFLVAGAQSVLMSLWKVNDQVTTQLIDAFYQHWLSGHDKSEALRLAQQAIRQTHPEPYFWGAFVLVSQ